MACKICGSDSKFFPLCFKCKKLFDDGEVLKCPDCKEYYIKQDGHKCEKATEKSDADKKVWVRSANEKNNSDDEQKSISIAKIDSDKALSKCIICESESNGLLFCKNCYYKYKNKVLLLKVSNCTKIELMDDSYEGIYHCADGHIVKSKSEKIIDDYLFKKNILHAYEKAFPIDNNSANDLHPDFYLQEQDLYIEHWGYDDSNVKYTEKKEYKIEQYEKRGVTVICTTEKDMTDIDAALERKLTFYKKGYVN